MKQQSKLDQYFQKQSSKPKSQTKKMNPQNNNKKRLSMKKSSPLPKSPRKTYQITADIVEILTSSDEDSAFIKNPHKKSVKVTRKITVSTPQEINARASKKKHAHQEKISRTPKNNVNAPDIKVEPQFTTMDTETDNVKEPQNMTPDMTINDTEVLSVKELSEAKSDSCIGPESPVNMVFNISPNTILDSKSSPKTPLKSTSPGSGAKYFSPTKKRVVLKKSPAKRSLSFSMNESTLSPHNVTEESETNKKAYKVQDDKTLFLLNIIERCLTNSSLKTVLEDNSQVLLQRCMDISQHALRLVCRLFWRLPGWYRFVKLVDIASEDKKQKLSTNEVFEIITTLVDCGLFIQAGTGGESSLTFDDYMKLLQKVDLQQICKDLKLDMKSKQNSIDALRLYCKRAPISNFFSKNKTNNNNTRVLEMLSAKTGVCYKLSEDARRMLKQLHILMYLGINDVILREKKLELVLIHDKIKRETYPIDKNMVLDDASIVFRTRDEFLRFYEARMLYEDYVAEESIETRCNIVQQAHELYKQLDGDILLRSMSLPVWLHRYTPANIYIKLLENGVLELKKLNKYTVAVQILDTLLEQVAFRQHKRSEWYAEKSLILHRWLDDPEKAAKVLLRGLESKMSDEKKEVLRSRAKMLAKQQNIDLKDELREALWAHTDDIILESSFPGEHIFKNPVDNYNQRGKLKFQIHTKEGKKFVSVEDYCIEYYIAQGTFTHGEHWEGRMVTSLFYLLFWDIIYSKPVGVNGIFLSYYQRHPLDMFTESFYMNRKTLIDERLAFIEECTEEMLLNIMLKTWDDRPEYEVSDILRSVQWGAVQALVQCAGARVLGALCRRLATNYGYAHSGFPDVTMWNVFTKKIKFIEVKSDADSPSIKQLQWIKYLREHDIDAGFCYVGSNTTRSLSRSIHDVTSMFD